MVRLLRFLLCALCITPLFALAVPITPYPVTSTALPGSGVALDISKATPAQTSIALRAPNVQMSTHAVGYESFQVFALDGEPFIPREGVPSLPQVSRFYQIPFTGSAQLVIAEADYDLVDNVNPLPYYPEGFPQGTVSRNGEVYARDAWYPSSVAEMSAPMVMRDFRVVQVALYPVQVNPVTHQARIYRNLRVDVVANDQPGENEITRPSRPSGSWAPIYRSTIANLDDGALDDMTTSPGTYMILTSSNSNIRPWADSLADWKTRKGYKVIISSHTDVSNQLTLRTAITAVYQACQNTGSPLEYVALMGDPDWTNIGIPANYGDFDHYYGLLAGSDDLEDVAIGRLSGNGSNEMANINAKIMHYERDPHMTNSQGQADTMWFHKAYFQASTAYSCASNYTLMQWAASNFRLYTGVDSIVVQQVSGFDRNAAVNRFNAGISFFAWRGSMQEVDPGLADATNPGWRLPICITVTCSAGEYIGQSGMAQSLLSAGTATNPKGGVCGIGPSTGGTHHPENVTMTGGFLYSIANASMEHLGSAVEGAKYWLFSTFGTFQSEYYYFVRYNNLFGDPGLSMWTDVPTVIDVVHPTSLNVGARQVELTVTRQADDAPIDGALVCLWKRGSDSTWVRGYTNATGHIVLPVSVNAPGTMYLTVSKQNHRPYLFDIPCQSVDCMPMLSSYSLDDDNSGGTHGNNDGVMNAGETLDLPIRLKNFGTTTTATGISAALTSNDTRVTIVNGTATYADLAPGDSVLGSQPFRIQVSGAMPHKETVQLTLGITSSAGQSSGVLELRCTSGDLVYISQQITGFGPGLTSNLSVTIKDSSTVPLSNVSAELQSFSPFVTINTGSAAYGNIAAGAQSTNSSSPFVVTANPMTFRGHQASMLLILTADNGFVDSTQFILPVGTAATTDPTGPDGYGYFAYDNSDAAYELHPVFNYINISAGLGTNLNIADIGEKTNTSQIWSVWRTLPFPFTFYGRTYDTLTICSNGWVAFGNQAWYDGARNYPIPAMQAPEAMIAPYWDDLVTSGSNLGVWVYYEADSGRYIIQWKATNAGSPATALNFEVILYDSAARPSMDGNNYVLVQYNNAAMNLNISQDNERPGCTIGIQAPRGLVGLPIAYCDWTNPSMAAIQDGRAILYTTDARVLFGQVEGTITDAATNQPLPGVLVTTDRYGFRDTTDAQGHYHLQDVMIGSYHILASRYRFNTDTSGSIMVALDSTTTLDFALRHPEMTLSVNAVIDSCESDPVQTQFELANPGNGPLDYTTRLYYAGDENDTPWDSVGAIDVTAATQDHQVWGCEFLFDQWWVTGAGDMTGQCRLYRFNLAGELVGSIPQPSTTPLGWFDLATDGTYLYGSDGPGILKIDTSGTVLDTIPSPMNPTRAIAYDPQYDVFWVADYTSNLYQIDRSGTTIQQIPNNGSDALAITGLAWNRTDASGYKLYAFSRNGTNSQIRITRIQPVAPYHRETAADLSGLVGDNAAGCAITSSWNSSLQVLGAVLRGGSGCRLGIYEMAFNSSWINLSPATGLVPGGNRQTMTVSFNPSILRNASYPLRAYFHSTVYDTTLILPITLVVNRPISGVPVPEKPLPTAYALHANYPNPFNPSTQIGFDLPKAEHVQLRVYNALGQLVATLADGMRPAGSHVVSWNGSGYASGLYLCQLRAGSFVQTRKMLLMK